MRRGPHKIKPVDNSAMSTHEDWTNLQTTQFTLAALWDILALACCVDPQARVLLIGREELKEAFLMVRKCNGDIAKLRDMLHKPIIKKTKDRVRPERSTRVGGFLLGVKKL